MSIFKKSFVYLHDSTNCSMYMGMRIILFVVLLLLNTSANAQRKRKFVRQPAPTAEELKHKEKMDRIIANTAQVMFIDSIAVSKTEFLSRYILNPEAGRIDTYQNLYKKQYQPNAYVYVNELGNRCILSQENNEGEINLYSSEYVDDKWTRQVKLPGINDNGRFRRVNYPFMLGDGETLYFAAEGDEGLGGYDIYTSTYDKETKRFLTPVNIGMPFNSEADDYMFVKWSDETFDNPKEVLVDHDITLAAFFNGTGVDENGFSAINLYPNPANDKIRIEGLEGRKEIRIYDAVGLLIKALDVDGENEIDISDLAAGFYFLRVDGHATKFVKQ